MTWDDKRVYVTGDVAVVKNLAIPMRDGILLSADMYLPASFVEGVVTPVPVVLDHIPYRKDEVALGGWGGWYYADLVRAGYAVARVDVRGTGSSQGIATDEYSTEEQRDGYDTVEWIAAQDWCDGHVCMMGISYGAFTSLQVAALQPPSLSAIVPMFFSDDRYDSDHYQGSVLRLWFDVGYYGTYLAAYAALPPDPLMPGWEELWWKRLGRQRPFMFRWFREQVDGPYWRNGSAGDVADRIRCPVLMIGGWRDGYPSAPMRLYEKLDVPKRAIVGPWNHAVPDVAIPGPRIDYLREVVEWLDRWCGRTTGPALQPPISVFMQQFDDPDPRRLTTSGEWRGEEHWPPDARSELVLHLGEGTLAADRQPGGSDEYDCPPDVGLTRGLWSYMSFGQPSDHRADEALSLCYTGQPLTDPLAILGAAEVELTVTSSLPVVTLVAVISDVAADGRSQLVTKGVLNCTRRHGRDRPEAVVPGRPFRVTVPLEMTGWVFQPGHRIRLSLSTADWPNLWPMPEACSISLDRAQSLLRLPVVPLRSSAPVPVFAPAAERDLSAATVPATWAATRELATGRLTFTLGFEREYEADGGTRNVKRAFALEACLDPHAPGGATVRGTHRTDLQVGDRLISACADVRMAGSPSAFTLTVALTADLDGTRRFDHEWQEEIPRVLM